MNLSLVHIIASTCLALFLVILSVGAVIAGPRERSAFLIGFGVGLIVTVALMRYSR